MKKIFFLLISYLLGSSTAFSQNVFEVAFGDSSNDYAKCVTPLFKGGYVVCGYTDGFGAGNFDAFLAKTDLAGNLIWFKTYGGTDLESSFNVIQTSDQGFALVGTTLSGSFGSDDIFVIKTDSNGDVEWSKIYGTSANDQGYDIRQTLNGEYVVAGFTTINAGAHYDSYVLKISSSGSLIWSEIFGAANNEGVYTIDFAANGNYIFAGKSEMNSNGAADYLLLEMDTSGNIIWMKNYGGVGYEVAVQVRRTADNGFIMSGYSDSYTSSGDYDLLAVKTDSAGNLEWANNYQQSSAQYSGGVVQGADGGYYFTGCSGASGTYDVFLFKTDAAGTISWAKTYQHGGTSPGYGFNFHESSAQLLCFAGYLTSGGNDDALVIVSDLGGNTGSDCTPVSTVFTVTILNDIVAVDPTYTLSATGTDADANFSVNNYTPLSSVLCLSTMVADVSETLPEIFSYEKEVYIQNNFSNHELTVTVCNTLGQIICIRKTSGISVTINMENTSPGIYIVKVTGNDQTVAEEVLIQ
ncbi:MAG TPA: T9SS type A sorting domain-containing protein [Chitinophagales bacterium]|nr:T9SS type A sorting domain-containing protein [Chitinophagales bacterium]